MIQQALIPGCDYVIKAFARNINKCYKFKLLSMGLTPGAVFKVTRFAPFGDTMQIEINDFSLSLRGTELQKLEIEAALV